MKKILVILLALSYNAIASESFDFAFGHLINFEGKKLDTSIGNVHSLYGVTKATLKRYNGRTDVQNLTLDTAKDIVYKLYWKAYELDRFMDKRNALLVLDFIYNSSSHNAIKQIQMAIGNKVTGKLSVSDIAKINYMGYKDFYKVYSKQRLGYMMKLKNYQKYKTGWGRRAESLGKL